MVVQLFRSCESDTSKMPRGNGFQIWHKQRLVLDSRVILLEIWSTLGHCDLTQQNGTDVMEDRLTK